MGHFCKGKHAEEYGMIGQTTNFILLVEYVTLLVALGIYFIRMYKKGITLIVQFKLYIGLIFFSGILKILIFSDPCVNYGSTYFVLVLTYGIPFYSSETIIISLW